MKSSGSVQAIDYTFKYNCIYSIIRTHMNNKYGCYTYVRLLKKLRQRQIYI